MKSIQFIKRVFFLGLIIGAAGFSQAATATGLLTPVNSALPALEMRSHEVEVTIQDGYSITNIDQVFHNPGQQDMDAKYEFPVPDQAAVSEFTVWIDNQPVVGEVLEKQKARKIHQEEKAAGRETGLAEQESYKRFEVAISPVRAGQDTRIRLQYMQPTDIKTGIGRYIYALEEGGVDEEKLSFWTANKVVTEHFRFTLNLRSAYPIEAMRAPNIADAVVTQASESEWRMVIDRVGSGTQSRTTYDNRFMDQYDEVVGLSPDGNEEYASEDGSIKNVNYDQTTAIAMQAEYTKASIHSSAANPAISLDEDIVVYWRLAQDLPASLDVVSHRNAVNGKGTFMMVMTPGDDLQPIEEGRDWMFVLDISGSMVGKYATLTKGVERALKKMPPNDRFRIVTFNNSANELTNGWVAVTEENIRHFSNRLSNVHPDKGTNLHSGIARGLRAIEKDRTSGIVLVTDGVANVGETEKRKFIELLRSYDTRVFTFIMGNEANRPLLKSISQASNGFALNVSNSDDIVGKIMEATQRINHQAMHDVELKLNGVRTSDITPGEIHSVYRGEQIIVFGHYWDAGDLDITLSTKISGEKRKYHQQITLPELATNNPEIERLWAFSKINDLQGQTEMYGENADTKQALIDLGVEHGIVTENTSMIVMREEQFIARGINRSNKKRLKKEKQAQIKRAAQPVTSHNQNHSAKQPMFQGNRANHSSGGGAFGAGWLLIFLPILIGTLINRRHI